MIMKQGVIRLYRVDHLSMLSMPGYRGTNEELAESGHRNEEGMNSSISYARGKSAGL